jgi:hypothetical protein
MATVLPRVENNGPSRMTNETGFTHGANCANFQLDESVFEKI